MRNSTAYELNVSALAGMFLGATACRVMGGAAEFTAGSLAARWMR